MNLQARRPRQARPTGSPSLCRCHLLCVSAHSEECHMTTLVPCANTRPYLGLAVMLFASTAAIASEAEELGHHRFHGSDYRHWKQPGTNISCCSDQDCAPVRAELREGQWFALRWSTWSDTADELGRSASPIPQPSEWITVPDEKILRVPNPAVESGHLCYSKGTVVCFVPPNTGI